ncbi:concanavalin A-like lectin/glucanase domain-containing protein [Glomus cerebriforme]|uniref:Concanavalin A-like lectin/glucanase domain-containing protein n=1 Tax=Glomus cerebriforme TaxID=658196 RepID=A0A397TIU4_9GLOM|nr:concanavalin A-like lectin/glucanase domain-containing protein [Glomus cerebriforme]
MNFLPSYLKGSPFERNPIDLPTRWNTSDSNHGLQVIGDKGLRVLYTGTGQNNDDAASIRTNHLIPAEVGLYYFEVNIIDAGESGYIGVGFGVHSAFLWKLPGWEPNTFGYHGDDGKKFRSSYIKGNNYGPPFTTGDTIGCGINFFNKTAFYTKNGICLGEAFDEITLDYYPMIGLCTRNECIEANFGDTPFLFDIEEYAKAIFKNAAKRSAKI